MTAISTIGRAPPNPGAVGLQSATSLDAKKISPPKLLATGSLSARLVQGNGPNSTVPTGIALNKPAASSVRLTGQMVLSSLYGQSRPASNMFEGFFGGLSSSEYAALSNRFIGIAKDVGLNVYRNDGLISGEGLAVDIPATEQGGRMLVRALARFDQVDDKKGGEHATQRPIAALLKAMGLDENKAFIKGMAIEAKLLELPWLLQSMLTLQTLLGMVPTGARGVNSNLGRATGSVAIVRNKPTGGGSNGPARNFGGPFTAPVLPGRTKQPQPFAGGASSAAQTSRATPIAATRPPRPIPPPSNAGLTSALRVAVVSSDLRSIENPKRFDAYINNLNGQSMETVGQVGVTPVAPLTPVTPENVTLSFRRQFYKSIKVDDLVTGRSPTVGGGIKHDWHLVFGTPSKLGESHASGLAFRVGLKTSWAERGQLPGQGGTKIAEFWKADAPNEYKAADTALTQLKSFKFDGMLPEFSTQITTPLIESGFIPQGSALATRLGRLESNIRAQNALAAEVSKADPSELATLQPRLKAANTAVDVSLKQINAQAVQTRRDLLIESLGTPKTTYELTVRHAAGARYAQSVEAQENPVFDAAKFKQILAAVKAEAGPESAVSLTWHREFVRAQMRNDKFNEAMQQSPAMRQAWSEYKAKYGI